MLPAKGQEYRSQIRRGRRYGLENRIEKGGMYRPAPRLQSLCKPHCRQRFAIAARDGRYAAKGRAIIDPERSEAFVECAMVLLIYRRSETCQVHPAR